MANLQESDVQGLSDILELIPRCLINFTASKIERRDSDLLVIGSGIAGLTAAIRCCGDLKITILTKGKLKEAATWYAQGGVATAMAKGDSPRLHYEDTIRAGAGLCDPAAVKVLASEAKGAIEDLISLGVDFDRALSGEIDLGLEGGHSLSRILHSGDSTGSEILSTLVEKVKLCQSLTIEEDTFALDLLTDEEDRVIGVIAKNTISGDLSLHYAKAVLLASGGSGQAYKITTSPKVATGDGIAMAYRAGAAIADLEFMQFHPTALDHKKSPRFLITEALRGEGAHLVDSEGNRFMVGVHPLAELAPRDIVARQMVKVSSELEKKTGKQGTHTYLDAKQIPAAKLSERFPLIWETCLESGYNLSKDLIPVSPAAHYTVGGVVTDTFGRSSLKGLYAAGETACAKIHGANRLASNSLLEGLVFSRRVCEAVKIETAELLGRRKVRVDYNRAKAHLSLSTEASLLGLKDTMTSLVGVIRDEAGLKAAKTRLGQMSAILQASFNEIGGFELQNMLTVSMLLCEAALARKESRGAHFRKDFPASSDDWRGHIEFTRGKPFYNFVPVKDER